jgi:hypothetical protein
LLHEQQECDQTERHDFISPDLGLPSKLVIMPSTFLQDAKSNGMSTLDDSCLIDAHVHSIRSDGTATPMQLASLARRSGLSAIVITDHDVLPNLTELHDAGERANISVVGGIELTVSLGSRTLHLLGYGFDARNESLVQTCRELREYRQTRWKKMITGLGCLSAKLDTRRLDQLGRMLAPGRRHLARELIRAGLASNLKSAFERYLSDQALRIQMPGPLSAALAIGQLHAAGGRAVLAHPPTNLTREEWRSLAHAGLDGIEVRYPRVARNHQRFLWERIREYQWAYTSGSDYHGDATNEYLGSRTMTASEWQRLLRYGPSTAKMPSISTATPSGKETNPNAERA